MSIYPYDQPVRYIAPDASYSPQTTVFVQPPWHEMIGRNPSLPPQPHQWVYAGVQHSGLTAVSPPIVMRSKPGVIQPIKSVPGNRSYEYVSLQAPRIPTAGDPRLGAARTSQQ